MISAMLVLHITPEFRLDIILLDTILFSLPLLLNSVFQMKCLGQPGWPPSRNEIPSLQILTEEVSLHCEFSNKRFGIPQHKYLDFTWSQSQRRAEVHPTERQIRAHRHICRWKRLVQLLSPFRVIS